MPYQQLIVPLFFSFSSPSDFFVEKRSRDLVGGQTSDWKKTLEKNITT
jgi:hypothetical protein